MRSHGTADADVCKMTTNDNEYEPRLLLGLPNTAQQKIVETLVSRGGKGLHGLMKTCKQTRDLVLQNVDKIVYSRAAQNNDDLHRASRRHGRLRLELQVFTWSKDAVVQLLTEALSDDTDAPSGWRAVTDLTIKASRRQDCSSWASLVGAACPQLTRLALHCKEVKPGLFQGLQACPLTHLELACGISSEAQQELSQLQPCLPFLTSLTVHRDEESISCLLRKFGHQLTSASMCSETGQAIAWLESLSQCTRLERLSIHGEQLNDEWLSAVCSLPALKHLRLGRLGKLHERHALAGARSLDSLAVGSIRAEHLLCVPAAGVQTFTVGEVEVAVLEDAEATIAAVAPAVQFLAQLGGAGALQWSGKGNDGLLQLRITSHVYDNDPGNTRALLKALAPLNGHVKRLQLKLDGEHLLQRLTCREVHALAAGLGPGLEELEISSLDSASYLNTTINPTFWAALPGSLPALEKLVLSDFGVETLEEGELTVFFALAPRPLHLVLKRVEVSVEESAAHVAELVQEHGLGANNVALTISGDDDESWWEQVTD